MKLIITLCCALLLLSGCGSGTTANNTEPSAQILGVRLGISREQALPRLQQIGTLEKQERKQQEVWALPDDQPYSHLIVSYDKEYKSMRFINAVAKEKRVRYSDVINTNQAKLVESGSSITYESEFPEKDNQPAYVVKAMGTDPEYLQYYAIEKKGN